MPELLIREDDNTLRPARPDEFVGSGQVGEMLGVSRQRVSQLYEEHRLPEPVVVVTPGSRRIRIWLRATVEEYVRTRPNLLDDDDGPLNFRLNFTHLPPAMTTTTTGDTDHDDDA